MLKKAIIGTLFVALAAGFILGRDCVSYMRTMGKSVRDAVQPAMNLDFETSLVLARKGFEVVLACRSENKALCERLWSLSEELLGVEFRI